MIDPADVAALYDSSTYVTGAPHEAIDRLRSGGPVVWVPAEDLGGGYWAVLSHAETKQVLRDAVTFSSHVAGTQLRTPARPEDLAFVQQMMLNQDPPDHTRLRRLLSAAFVPRAIAALEREIAERAAALVARVEPRDEFDLVGDVVGDLPVAVLAAVLGLPDEDRGLLYDWSNRVIGFQDADYATSSAFDAVSGTEMARAALRLRPEPDASGAMPDPRTRAGLADMYDYAQRLADYRRREPGEDIVSLLLAADVDGRPLTNDEFETMFFLFAVAGNETLRNGIPGGMFTLMQHPEHYDAVIADPTLLPGAIEEMLRYWPPVIHFRRTATIDVRLANASIAAGDRVAVYHLAANRDPAVFEDPHRFDIGRSPNDHVSFGFGAHFCLGSHLARTQMRCMIGELNAQLGRLEPVGEPSRLQSNFQQGLKALPVSRGPRTLDL
ncbi:MAG: cytochrome P450 [Actinomycetota bacterium]